MTIYPAHAGINPLYQFTIAAIIHEWVQEHLEEVEK